MSRLIFFGDSFASQSNINFAWPNQLTRKFDAEQVNYATNGSSIEFSMYQFTKYMKNNYKKTDKIVFVLTHPSRSPIVHPDYDPKSSAIRTATKPTNKHKLKSWLHLHLQLARYSDHETDIFKYFIVTSMLNSIPNDALLLCAFDSCNEKSNRDNFIVSKINLFNHSENKETVNHFYEHNHNAMADCAYRSIVNKKDLFDPNLFTSGSNPVQYMKDWVMTKAVPFMGL